MTQLFDQFQLAITLVVSNCVSECMYVHCAYCKVKVISFNLQNMHYVVLFRKSIDRRLRVLLSWKLIADSN